MPAQDEIVGSAATPSIANKEEFEALLDKTFGKGKWRMGGAYRTKERENELRAEGAGTVPPGHTSHHSLGTPDAPGAYDVTVEGLNPRQIARRLRETGADFEHFHPEETRAAQGAHLHIDVPVGKKPVDDEIVRDEPTPMAKPKPSFLEGVADSFADIPREIGKQVGEAYGNVNKALAQERTDTRNATKVGPLRIDTHFPMNAANTAMSYLDLAASPIEGALTSIIGRPVEKVTGVPRRTAADVAQLAVPFAGEATAGLRAGKLAEEAGVGANYGRKILADRKAITAAPTVRSKAEVAGRPTLAQTAASVGPLNAAKVLAERPNPDYAARVARLESDGISLTPGMKLGGKAKIIEDASTSNPYRGQAVVDARNHAIETFNAAVYNKALAPLGEKFPTSVKPGRDAIGYVGKKLGAAYDAILPRIKVQMDDETVADLAHLEKAADKLGIPQSAQFKAIVDQDVLHHMPIGGVIDGQTFKAVQSDLLRQSRAFKGSQDPNQRAMGHMLDDVLDALTASAERHSPAGTREQLRKVNEGYAVFTRLQDAATRRIATQQGATPGVFTPGDLVAAVKKGDRTVRKGAFARGDALLQGFAEDAESVLPSKVGDSGTATRLNVTRPGPVGAIVGTAVGGLPGALVGAGVEAGARPAANALSSRLLSPSKTPMVRNYLLAAKRRLDAKHAAEATAAAAGAADLGNHQ